MRRINFAKRLCCYLLDKPFLFWNHTRYKKMLLNNFLKYSIFFPKTLFFAIEQRLKYWVKQLGFFICRFVVLENQKNAFVPDRVPDFLDSDEHRSTRISAFYFSFKKYFFYFLLLKFFFKNSKKKLAIKKSAPAAFFASEVSRQSTTGVKQVVTSSVATDSTFGKSTAGSTREDAGGTNRSRAFVNLSSTPFELKSARTVFLVTTTAQEWFLKNFFYKADYLIILFSPNLITNRKFFYKMLFGFHEERKNVAYPRRAYRRARISSSLVFSNWAGVEFFRDAFFFNKIRREFLLFFKLFLLRAKDHSIFFNWLKLIPQISTAGEKKRLEFFNKHFLNDSSSWFIFFITRFFSVFWLKLYLSPIKYNFLDSRLSTTKALYFWRKSAFYINNFGGGIISSNSYRAGYFLNMFSNFYKNVVWRLITLILNYGFLFKQQLFFSRHIFDKQASLVKNPQAVSARQNLVNNIMLLKFLPISLVILFISSVNKQVLRDVFRLRLPSILISSMEHCKLPSDYSYPGNAFEFNILYFYTRFITELIDTA